MDYIEGLDEHMARMNRQIWAELYSLLKKLMSQSIDTVQPQIKFRSITFIFESLPKDIGRQKLNMITREFLTPLDLP